MATQSLLLDFQKSLGELTFNSAPLIKTLSVVAGESLSLAAEISEAIQLRINKAPPTQKLFAFYLLDSICKNVGNPYNILLGASIYDTFTRNYTLVSDAVRQKLINLFTTWRDTRTATGSPLFPQDQLDRIEEFLLRATRTLDELSTESLVADIDGLIPLVMKKMKEAPASAEKLATQREGLDDIKKLLNSTRLPVKTLVQIKDKLVGFRKDVMAVQAAPVGFHGNVNGPHRTVNGPSPGTMYNAPPAMAPSAPPGMAGVPGMTPEMLQAMYAHFQKQQNGPPAPVPVAPGPSKHPNDVLAKLVLSGLVKPPKGAAASKPSLSVLQSLLPSKAVAPARTGLAGLSGLLGLTPPPDPLKCTNEAELFVAIDLANPAAFINGLHPRFQNLLYGYRSKKCGTCGKRFSTTSNVELTYYEAHLDWHFRVSKKVLEHSGKLIQNRMWFLDDLEWVAFRDREEILEFSVSSKKANRTLEPANVTPEVSLPKQTYVVIDSTADSNTTFCSICKDSITGVYSDDHGEWIWPNAIQVKQAGQMRTFHYSCYEETVRLSEKRPMEGAGDRKREKL